jgi:hypothetical protein
MSSYPSKPSSAPAIPFGSKGTSKNLNDIFSAIAVESLLALRKDGTGYENNFSIGDNAFNSLVNEINIRQGSTIKEYDATGTNLLRTLTFGSATTTAQGFRFLDEPIKISNNTTNPLTEIDISAGVMTFDDGSGQVLLPTTLTRSTANDFENGGLLPNGAVLQTNTMYYVFAIYSTSSNLVSFYADTSKTSPTLPQSPNSYDKKQYRGAFYVDITGNIIEFQQLGRNYFEYKNRYVEYSTNIGTSQVAINCLYQPLENETLSHFYIAMDQGNITNPNRLLIKPSWKGNISSVDIVNQVLSTGFITSSGSLRDSQDIFIPFTSGNKTLFAQTSNQLTQEFRLISLGYYDLSLKD